MKIEIELKSCSECPFCDIQKVYTPDSWDNVSKWTCKHIKSGKEGRVISSYVDWYDKKEGVPTWCPAKVK